VFDNAVVCGGGTEDWNNKVVEASGAQGYVREVVRGFQFPKNTGHELIRRCIERHHDMADKIEGEDSSVEAAEDRVC